MFNLINLWQVNQENTARYNKRENIVALSGFTHMIILRLIWSFLTDYQNRTKTERKESNNLIENEMID